MSITKRPRRLHIRHAARPRQHLAVQILLASAAATLTFTSVSPGYAAEPDDDAGDVSFSAHADVDTQDDTADGAASSRKRLPFPTVTSGWQAGFSTGFAIGTGEFSAGGGQLSDNQRGMIPLWLDVGYRFTPSLFVGAYGQMGFLLLRKGGVCQGEENQCSGQNYRAGLTIHYHFAPKGLLDPWVGAGAGYEWYYNTVSVPTSGVGSLSLLLRGWEMVNLRVGLDIHDTKQGALGPFVAWSMGQYGNLSLDGIPGEQKSKSDPINNKATHQWIMFGVQGSYFDDF